MTLVDLRDRPPFHPITQDEDLHQQLQLDLTELKEGALYALTMPGRISAAELNEIQRIWRETVKKGKLIILDRIELTELTDDHLASVGLKRVD